jgi:hypothetical protein
MKSKKDIHESTTRVEQWLDVIENAPVDDGEPMDESQRARHLVLRGSTPSEAIGQIERERRARLESVASIAAAETALEQELASLKELLDSHREQVVTDAEKGVDASYKSFSKPLKTVTETGRRLAWLHSEERSQAIAQAAKAYAIPRLLKTVFPFGWTSQSLEMLIPELEIDHRTPPERIRVMPGPRHAEGGSGFDGLRLFVKAVRGAVQ